MRVLFLSLGAAALILGAYTFWVHHNTTPFLESRELQLQPSTFVLKQTGPLREIDLGYAKVSVPAVIDGELIRYDDSLFVSFVSEGNARSILICPPYHESSAALDEFRASSRQVFGGTVSWHDAQAQAAATRPVSFADLFLLGPNRRQLALLAIKSLVLSGALDVRIYEGSRIGAIIIRRSDLHTVDIFHRPTGTYQSFLLQPDNYDFDEAVSAIVSTYQAKADARTEEQFRRLLENTGIPSKPATLAAETQQTDAERLHRVADEIRQLRASRTEP